MKNPTKDEILAFISRFTLHGRLDQVKTTFTNGCCYWFAFILLVRFPTGTLVYDEVVNHFAAEIDGTVYDITGDITGKYDMVPWSELDDDVHKNRIIRDCILF